MDSTSIAFKEHLFISSVRLPAKRNLKIIFGLIGNEEVVFDVPRLWVRW
jgi:hypothetical protein